MFVPQELPAPGESDATAAKSMQQWFADKIATPLTAMASPLTAFWSSMTPLSNMTPLTQDDLERAEVEYTAADTDGDNKLDFSEFCTMCREREQAGDVRVQDLFSLRELFDTLDASKDGKIDPSEYVKWLEAEKESEEAAARMRQIRKQARDRRKRYFAKEQWWHGAPPASFSSAAEATRFFMAPMRLSSRGYSPSSPTFPPPVQV